MKVGDLVKVKPSREGIYIVTSMEARCEHTRKKLPRAVMLVCLDDNTPPSPMNKKWIEVISENR